MEDALKVEDVEDIVNQTAFEVAVEGSVCSHGGSSVDLYQPGFQRLVHHEVVAVELKGVSAREDVFLDCLEGSQDDVGDFCEAPVYPLRGVL